MGPTAKRAFTAGVTLVPCTLDSPLKMPELHYLSLRPDVAGLPLARRTVRGFLRQWSVDEDSSQDIIVSLQEALKNAVRFSGVKTEIDVILCLADDSVCVVVKDKGRGFDRELLQGSRSQETPDPLSPSGRGLFLITQLMDEVRLGSDGGAEVRMLKRLPRH